MDKEDGEGKLDKTWNSVQTFWLKIWNLNRSHHRIKIQICKITFHLIFCKFTFCAVFVRKSHFSIKSYYESIFMISSISYTSRVVYQVLRRSVWRFSRVTCNSNQYKYYSFNALRSMCRSETPSQSVSCHHIYFLFITKFNSNFQWASRRSTFTWKTLNSRFCEGDEGDKGKK